MKIPVLKTVVTNDPMLRFSSGDLVARRSDLQKRIVVEFYLQNDIWECVWRDGATPHREIFCGCDLELISPWGT